MNYISFLCSILILGGISQTVSSQEISSAGEGTLTVMITNFRNNQGMANVALYNKESSFPKLSGDVVRLSFSKIEDGMSVAVFERLPPGEYAIAVFHDENMNRKMDTNFIGIPKEGIGASNNARGHFGPPRYRDAKFYFNGTRLTISLSMTYL